MHGIDGDIAGHLSGRAFQESSPARRRRERQEARRQREKEQNQEKKMGDAAPEIEMTKMKAGEYGALN